jgi:phytoene synthase
VARDTNFYYSFLVLPADKRRAIVGVWDFCRAVVDAVDEPGEGSGSVDQALAAWRGEIARCFEDRAPETAQGRALQPLIARFALPRRPFEDLVDGVAMDAGHRRYRTFEELREYCYRVASTVGLICLEIFGYGDARSRDYAVNLGLALQLTNILRDVKADLGRDRLYIPTEDLARFGCTEEDLRRGQMTPAVRALLAHQGERARHFYAQARAALPPSDARQLVAAEIMGAIYRAILDKIERRAYDVFSELVRIPRPRRAWIAAATWARVVLGSGAPAP